MDYIEDYRLIQSLLKGEPLDQDVYDAAAWSAVVGASVRSVADRGRPVGDPRLHPGQVEDEPTARDHRGLITPGGHVPRVRVPKLCT